ncbi:unnamed protein product [Miscanthus lutarioriparius]|uniref:Uncharacterized protein n=1 Tax=Miscanthus lutarioriparius TaxID=422564 RepID=A0A811QIX3_9POAL|nr:unnamed protein product [Miscanthus lutarioriparius]
MKAAARLMEKIVPGASAMKAKSSSKKDRYLLKRQGRPRPPPPPPVPHASLPDDGPPGFPASGDHHTPPLPGSSIADEDFMLLQRRTPLVEVPPPAAHQAQPTEGPAGVAVAPKKVTKPKKPPTSEAEEGADADADASPGRRETPPGKPKKRKKKKKLSYRMALVRQGRRGAGPQWA